MCAASLSVSSSFLLRMCLADTLCFQSRYARSSLSCGETLVHSGTAIVYPAFWYRSSLQKILHASLAYLPIPFRCATSDSQVIFAPYDFVYNTPGVGGSVNHFFARSMTHWARRCSPRLSKNGTVSSYCACARLSGSGNCQRKRRA